MTVPGIVNHLKMVAEREGIKAEPEALHMIAEKADGGMRDALSIFDQAASFSQGDITYKKVLEDLNILDSEYYFKVIDQALEMMKMMTGSKMKTMMGKMPQMPGMPKLK